MKREISRTYKFKIGELICVVKLMVSDSAGPGGSDGFRDSSGSARSPGVHVEDVKKHGLTFHDLSVAREQPHFKVQHGKK